MAIIIYGFSGIFIHMLILIDLYNILLKTGVYLFILQSSVRLNAFKHLKVQPCQFCNTYISSSIME